MYTFIAIVQTMMLAFLPSYPATFNISNTNNVWTNVDHAPHYKHFCTRFHNTKANVRNILLSNETEASRLLSFSGMGKLKTIVIDPGHGGHDPGCSGSNSREKHLALAIAKKLNTLIKAKYPHLNVIMTRDKDVFIPLYERAKIANKANADLFISIHCNYFPAGGFVRGSETYVMGLHTAEHNLEVAKRENDAILYEDDYEKNYDYDPNSTEGHIMLSMFQNVFLEQSIVFAELVENSFSVNAKRKSRGVKQAGFVVLKETAMPSVLIETGFLSNYKEEQYLKTSAGQENIARAVAKAFDEYKYFIENELSIPSDYPDLDEEMPIAVKEAPVQESRPSAPPILTDVTPKAVPAVMEQSIPSSSKSAQVKAASIERPFLTQEIKLATKGQAVPIDSLEKMVATASLEDKYQFFIQLASTTQPVDTKKGKWANIPYQLEIEVDGKTYKYRARNFENLQKAIEGKQFLKHLGFTDAFIVAYKNGVKVQLDTLP